MRNLKKQVTGSSESPKIITKRNQILFQDSKTQSPYFQLVKSAKRTTGNSLFNLSTESQTTPTKKNFEINNINAIQKLEEESKKQENQLKDIIKSLCSFYNELGHIIKLHFGHDEELMKLLFEYELELRDLGVQQEEINDAFIFINIIKDIVKHAFILKLNIEEISPVKQQFQNLTEQDLILLCQKTQQDLQDSMQSEKELKFLLETTKSKMQQYQNQNKFLIQKSKETFEEYRQDNIKLITSISEQQQDIKTLNSTLNNRKIQIKDLEEKLLSMFVLEFKIRQMDVMHTKELDKCDKSWQAKMNELKDINKSFPEIALWKKEMYLELQAKNLQLQREKSEKNYQNKYASQKLKLLKGSFENSQNQVKQQSQRIYELEKETSYSKKNNQQLNKLKNILTRKNHIQTQILFGKTMEAPLSASVQLKN